MYSHGKHKISKLMNRFLHKFLDLTPEIFITILFCQVSLILLLGELPPKNDSTLHHGVKIGKRNSFEGVSVADM
jgi:hypothetical protein